MPEYGLEKIVKSLHSPRSVVFRVKRHPQVAGFEQCVSFGAFSSEQQEVVYNVFCLCAMYFLPLIIITVCYVCIFCEIHRSSKELDEKRMHRSSVGHVRLRRSDRRVLERARRRTLRMTVTIVAVFALCWLPYATITMWYMVDRESAARLSPRVQDLLFVMAVSNSCMNPLVYGSYTLDLKGLLRRLIKKTCCHSSAASDTIGIDGSGSSSIKNRNVNLETLLMKSVKVGNAFVTPPLRVSMGGADCLPSVVKYHVLGIFLRPSETWVCGRRVRLARRPTRAGSGSGRAAAGRYGRITFRTRLRVTIDEALKGWCSARIAGRSANEQTDNLMPWYYPGRGGSLVVKHDCPRLAHNYKPMCLQHSSQY
ncbi:unnamed protein product [Spodoptera exigua]|nr:unnamed protein product [Spodoptera exigua]